MQDLEWNKPSFLVGFFFKVVSKITHPNSEHSSSNSA